MIKRDELEKITSDQDYVHAPKFDNSLKKVLDHYPDGAPDSVICKILCISQRELDKIYESALNKLRKGMVKDE